MESRQLQVDGCMNTLSIAYEPLLHIHTYTRVCTRVQEGVFVCGANMGAQQVTMCCSVLQCVAVCCSDCTRLTCQNSWHKWPQMWQCATSLTLVTSRTLQCVTSAVKDRVRIYMCIYTYIYIYICMKM